MLFSTACCSVKPTSSVSSPVTGVSSTPSSSGSETDDTGAEGETQQQNVPIFVIVISAVCVGLVLIFSVVLLIMLCCLHRQKSKQKEGKMLAIIILFLN